MRDDQENIIVKLTFEYALMIIEFAEELEVKRKFVFANQILKKSNFQINWFSNWLII